MPPPGLAAVNSDMPNRPNLPPDAAVARSRRHADWRSRNYAVDGTALRIAGADNFEPNVWFAASRLILAGAKAGFAGLLAAMHRSRERKVARILARYHDLLPDAETKGHSRPGSVA